MPDQLLPIFNTLFASRHIQARYPSAMLGRLGAGARSTAAPLFKRQLANQSSNAAAFVRQASTSAVNEVGLSYEMGVMGHMTDSTLTCNSLLLALPPPIRAMLALALDIETISPDPHWAFLHHLGTTLSSHTLYYYHTNTVHSHSPSSPRNLPSPSSPSSQLAV